MEDKIYIKREQASLALVGSCIAGALFAVGILAIMFYIMVSLENTELSGDALPIAFAFGAIPSLLYFWHLKKKGARKLLNSLGFRVKIKKEVSKKD